MSTIHPINSILDNLNLNVQSDEITIYNSFLLKYANKDFFIKMFNVCLYQADFSSISGISKNAEVIKFLRTFLNDLNSDIKNTNIVNIQVKPLAHTISIIRKILDIKEDPTARLLTYDTVNKQFNNLDPFCAKLIETTKQIKIDNFQQFRSELEDIIKEIEVYNELKQIKIIAEEIDALKQESTRNDVSPLNLLRNFKDIIQKGYGIFSTLKTVSNDDEIEKYLEFYDESSTPNITSNLVKYLTKSFSSFVTGYTLLDQNIDGIESSSVYLISAASSNGKSLFVMNILRNIIMNPKNKFEPNDIILFVTLEDDVYKVYRRFLGIFGNINPSLSKKLFKHCSAIIQETKDIDIKFKNVEADIKKLVTKITNNSIHTVTKGRCRLGLIHSNSLNYTMSDITRVIDRKKAEGYNVKAVFIDYVDMMKISNPVNSKENNDEYVTHGKIVQEMKVVCREYAIPVVSITQNGKAGENPAQNLDNSIIGDSYKKIRYSDVIIMARQDHSKSITNSEVMKDVLDSSYNIASLPSVDYYSSLVPMYIKITKAKEGQKNMDKYHIFNPLNLRIYNTFDDVIEDMKMYKNINEELLKDIESIGLLIDNDIIFDVTDEFENIIM
jgi:hypothetical protein